MGLMDILNGMQNGPRGQARPDQGGGMSPITIAMLALLAYKAYGKMTAGQTQAAPDGQVSPSQGGDVGDLLGGLLGGAGPRGAGAVPGGSGGLGDLLGGMLGGGAAAGGTLNSGLKSLIDNLQESGQGDVAKSWVGTGANKQISPRDLSRALGDDTVNSLADEAGLSRIDLLDGLSQQLPQFVDQLTPNGRLPTDQEMSRMI